MLLPLLLAAAVASGSLASARFEASAAAVERFDVLEVRVEIDGPPPGNPFTDVSLEGTFGPDYRLVLRQGASERTHEGAFTATEGGRPGPVRVDPEHPFHFVREGTGRHWFWNGTTAYLLLAWDDETLRTSVSRLADLGVNRLRVALCGRPKDGSRWNEPLVQRSPSFSFKLEPWIAARPDDVASPGYDVTRFNLGLFRKAERLLRHARERDVVVSLVFYVDGRDAGVDPFGRERMGGEDERRYYRYVVARLASFPNVMWDVTNEHHLFRDEAWVSRMGALVKEHDPYDHLTSVHGHGQFPFRREAWADFASYQSWDEHGGYAFMLRNRREQEAAGRPMPQANEEYGYEDHYPYPWGEARLWPARTADTRRRLAWEMTMAGAYQTTGERADEGTGAGLDAGGGWINGRGSGRMTMLVGYGHLRRFFEGFEWWRLEPRPDLVRLPPEPKRESKDAKPDAPPPLPSLHPHPMLLAEPGVRYVAYLPRGGTATLVVEGHPGRARWYDPRSGTFREAPAPAGPGEWTSPPAPDAEDWVLLLERASS